MPWKSSRDTDFQEFCQAFLHLSREGMGLDIDCIQQGSSTGLMFSLVAQDQLLLYRYQDFFNRSKI